MLQFNKNISECLYSGILNNRFYISLVHFRVFLIVLFTINQTMQSPIQNLLLSSHHIWNSITCLLSDPTSTEPFLSLRAFQPQFTSLQCWVMLRASPSQAFGLFLLPAKDSLLSDVGPSLHFTQITTPMPSPQSDLFLPSSSQIPSHSHFITPITLLCFIVLIALITT